MENLSPARLRYRDFNRFLRERFGLRVQKITIDAGFTCPNRDGTLSRNGCIYCDPLGAGTGAWAKGLGVTEQIERAKKALSERYRARGFLAYFQAFTNTYAPLPRLRSLYQEALQTPGVLGLCVGTRPDCVNEDILDLLATYTDRWMIWVEFGLQSAHDETLRRINRGHDVQTFFRAVTETARRGILVCAHLIIGLPGEGPEEIRETACRISLHPIQGIKVHSLYIVRHAPLEKLYLQGAYQPWAQDQYAESVCDLLERVPAHWVVQRLTGDPPRHDLVAPAWVLEKQQTLEAIWERLLMRDTWQGRLLGAPQSEG
jgi:radical SAM protein (TIGR01212 family)